MQRRIEGLGLVELPRRQLAAVLRREIVAVAAAVTRLGLPLVPERVRFAARLAEGEPGTVETIEFEIFLASGGWEVVELNARSSIGQEAGHGR